MQLNRHLLLLLFFPLLLPAAPCAAAEAGGGGKAFLREAAPSDLAAALSELAGFKISVEGGTGRRISLELDATRPQAAIQQAAAALGGTASYWLRVRPGYDPAAAPYLPLDREITAGLVDLPAEAAYRWAARQLGAHLDYRAASGARANLVVSGATATTLLNRLAEQTGTKWSMDCVITAPPAPPLPAADPLPAPRVQPPSRRDRSELPAPLQLPGELLPEPKLLNIVVRQELLRLLQTPAGDRKPAARQMIGFLDQLGSTLKLMQPEERRARIQALLPLRSAWRQLFEGLPPRVQGELAGVDSAFFRLPGL